MTCWRQCRVVAEFNIIEFSVIGHGGVSFLNARCRRNIERTSERLSNRDAGVINLQQEWEHGLDLTGAENIVIIGGGQAGAQAAFSLRQWGYEGALTLVGEEPVPPYQRPPLSKAYLKGEMAEERLYFKPEDWYAENGVTLLKSETATEIDRAGRRVELSGGQSLFYDALILATGSRPKPLPIAGAELGNVFELRSLADVKRLAAAAKPGKRLVIVGAGYIGLEAAAVAARWGLKLRCWKWQTRVLERVTSPTMSEFYEAEHTRQGVDIRCGVRLEKLEGEGDVTGAKLASGEVIPGRSRSCSVSA